MIGPAAADTTAAGASAAITQAIGCLYADAHLAPPTIASASRIVPLLRLLADQPLYAVERADLTRAKAAAFLEQETGQAITMAGPPTAHLSSYLHATPHAGYILVHQGEPMVQRRYAIAHELGHYVLHALPLFRGVACSVREARERTPSSASHTPQPAPSDRASVGAGVDCRSIVATATATATAPARLAAHGPIPDMTAWGEQAEQFAARLLMPAALCRDLVATYSGRCGRDRAVLCRLLASELLVSEAALHCRLEGLGLGSHDA
jgi:hypothetical protein